ncbi:MAG: GNAT family N-acetyltransferase [Clostridia bacterium]|nr:GNAT family N-acetyltransferase [Clostridia bacterium]MDQ7791008.1 GNAT family N-acetyltransferase [Clostridia bacterium]
MKYRIVQGTVEYLADCLEAFQDSDLGRNYASSPELLSSKLTDGFSKGELFVALDEADQYLGHVWIVPRGGFDNFPYCRILAVKSEFRGRGIGTALLRYFEETGFQKSDRLFILVSDFNSGAKRLYERLGYKQVGCVPDLFKNGIAECILVKYRTDY